MEYYIYYSHQKVMQLFRQLPESRCVAVKISRSGNSHSEADFLPGEPKEERCLRAARVSRNVSDGSYRESCFDPNDMYQLRQVTRALRREGKLCCLKPGCCPRPGCYAEISGLFAPEESEAPPGSFWIAAPAQGGCPALRLLCCGHTFCGDNEDCARLEVWCCGAPLPLHGAVLVLNCDEDTLCGLPLCLSI